MSLDAEISRLLDLMPASGRMSTKLIAKPQQAKVIEAPFPVPWRLKSRTIYINFDLWRHLSRGERDLILLRTVCNLIRIKWLRPNLYQGMALAGAMGLAIELMQADALGAIVAGGLTAIAARQLWIQNRSLERELDADEAAIKVATRRGYSEVEAARYLLSGMEAIAHLERRSGLDFTELIRAQNLKAKANLSPMGVPADIRQQ